MMIRQLILRLALVVSFSCMAASAAAERYSEKWSDGSICDWDTLYIMHPGNLKDHLSSMVPKRSNGYLNFGDLTLHNLVRDGDIETIKALLEAGLDPNPVNHHGLTPLSIAAAMKQTDIVSLLLEAGVDPNWTSKNEYYPCMTTPLHWAAYLGHIDVATVLLDAGADKNAASKNGSTPIVWANAAGHADMLLLLLKAGQAKPTGTGQGTGKIVQPE